MVISVIGGALRGVRCQPAAPGRHVAGQIGRSRFHFHRGFPSRARGGVNWLCVKWRCDTESVGVFIGAVLFY